jgi:hypothetical protein
MIACRHSAAATACSRPPLRHSGAPAAARRLRRRLHPVRLLLQVAAPAPAGLDERGRQHGAQGGLFSPTHPLPPSMPAALRSCPTARTTHVLQLHQQSDVLGRARSKGAMRHQLSSSLSSLSGQLLSARLSGLSLGPCCALRPCRSTSWAAWTWSAASTPAGGASSSAAAACPAATAAWRRAQWCWTGESEQQQAN